jgi:hypothetical protein
MDLDFASHKAVLDTGLEHNVWRVCQYLGAASGLSQNPKHEIRNPKQIQMTTTQNSKRA